MPTILKIATKEGVSNFISDKQSLALWKADLFMSTLNHLDGFLH